MIKVYQKTIDTTRQITVFVRLLKELSQFLIGVGLFDRFLVFDRGHDN